MKHLLLFLLLLSSISFLSLRAQSPLPSDAQAGLTLRAWQLPEPLTGIPALIPGQAPNIAFVSDKVMFEGGKRSQTPLDQMSTDFYMRLDGWVKMANTDTYQFRLSANEGARLYIDDSLRAEIGPVSTGFPPIDVQAQIEFSQVLNTDPHSIRIESFNRGGQVSLKLEWYIQGIQTYAEVPKQVLWCVSPEDEHIASGIKRAYSPQARAIPGDGHPVAGVHPSWTIEDISIPSLEPRITGMDFLSENQLVFCTWDATGGVYLLDNPGASPTVRQIGSGLSEPMGVEVKDKQIYVLQKDEITQLIDQNEDGVADEYRTIANGWPISANPRAFTSGFVSNGTDYFLSLTQATNGFGTPLDDQSSLRGSVVQHPQEIAGTSSAHISGLYAPLGIAMSKDGRPVVLDQSEPGIPTTKMWMGGQLQAVALLPKGPVSRIPSQALQLSQGPYQGQWLVGDLVQGGLRRVFVEEVEGQLQGCVFRFSQGFEGGIARMIEGPDGSIYAGLAGFWNEWSQAGHRRYGLQRFSYTGEAVFEMKTVSARSNGLEIEFSEPIAAGQGREADNYGVFSWNPFNDSARLTQLTIQAVEVSADRTKARLQIQGLQAGQLLILHIRKAFVSESQHSLWSTEAWYTLNQIPNNQELELTASDPLDVNTLSEAEVAAGWKLLFDGQSTAGWRNFKQEEISAAWQVQDGALFLAEKGGGDIITIDQYENFELSLEWMISPGGNSGVFFHVSEEFEEVWYTGPEIQILDDLRHPDNAWHSHRAGSNYDIHPASIEALNPVGQFNHLRVIVNQGQVEHWLNGYKIVEYELWTEEWKTAVQNSKFASRPRYGREKRGHIALQDHGDRVAFRNIKIREITP
ncbi:MAG: family 16 glycoside hydrolase [Bacteroidota bacterium]